jgi:hypothetical protein
MAGDTGELTRAMYEWPWYGRSGQFDGTTTRPCELFPIADQPTETASAVSLRAALVGIGLRESSGPSQPGLGCPTYFTGPK